jgi:hypothetical protein
LSCIQTLRLPTLKRRGSRLYLYTSRHLLPRRNYSNKNDPGPESYFSTASLTLSFGWDARTPVNKPMQWEQYHPILCHLLCSPLPIPCPASGSLLLPLIITPSLASIHPPWAEPVSFGNSTTEGQIELPSSCDWRGPGWRVYAENAGLLHLVMIRPDNVGIQGWQA